MTRRRFLASLALIGGGAALWPAATWANPGAAPELPTPFALPARELDRAGVLREVTSVVSRQAREVGAPTTYAARVGPIAERVDFLHPFQFLVTSYFERDPARRDALLAAYAREPAAAIRELGPAFPSPRAEMILNTLAYYDVSADRIRVNLGRITPDDAARVLVHEFWHALPDLRTWKGEDGATLRTTGFWTQRLTSEQGIWQPLDDTDGLPHPAYLLNEAMATQMEVRYAGPTKFKRPDLDGANGYLARLSETAGSADVMEAYLRSRPGELHELAEQHQAARVDAGALPRT